jgi:hypothetical protein
MENNNTDLGNYKGVINTGKSFVNYNADKVALNEFTPYTFEMKKFIMKKGVKNFKGETVDKLYMIAEEVTTHNEIIYGFRIDKLTPSPDHIEYQTPVLTFFERLGQPVSLSEYPKWTEYFIETRRFTANVQRIVKNGQPTVSYKLLIETVKKPVIQTT